MGDDPYLGLADGPDQVNIMDIGTSDSDRLGNSSVASMIKLGVQANKFRGKVSTSAVIAELAKDKEHMELFNEYVKYERLVTEFAWKMHHPSVQCSYGGRRTICFKPDKSTSAA